MMQDLQARSITDTWIATSWDDYVRILEDPRYEKAKGYYYKEHMRLEMLPVSFDHGSDHVAIIFAVNLFTAIQGIAATGLDTTTLRKPGVRDCQPDVAYYLGRNAKAIPRGTGIVDLDRYPAPNLVIEVAKSSLLDDVGAKRALYEELGVAEYWVVDVQNAQVLAYTIADQGSKRVQKSLVLPGLTISILEEALRRGWKTDQAQAGSWLLTQFQKKED
jgi:Uma2 family endonuclease